MTPDINTNAVSPKIRVMYRGTELDRSKIRWMPKAAAYQIIGTREYLPRETLEGVTLYYFNASDRFIAQETQRLQRQEINVAEWRAQLLSSLMRYTVFSAVTWYGALDLKIEGNLYHEFPREACLQVAAIKVFNHSSVALLCNSVLAGKYDTFSTMGAGLLICDARYLLDACAAEGARHREIARMMFARKCKQPWLQGGARDVA